VKRSGWLQKQAQRITWPDTLGGPTQGHALRLFWWNGLLDNLSESFVFSYLPLFALSCGATNGQVGLLSSLSNLLAVAGLWPGGRLAECWPRRKWVVMLSMGGAARLMLLGLASLPLFFHSPSIIWLLIALAALRAFFTNFGLPAWMALSADLVPEAVRGRYFGSRNFAMRLASLVGRPLAGMLIQQAGAPRGYQLSMGLAGGVGLLSTAVFGRIPEPPLSSDERRAVSERWALLPALRARRTFLAFCLVALIWTFSIQLAGPFFNVHLVHNLGGTTATVGWLGALFSLSSMAGQRLFGRLSDRKGPLWAMRLTGLMIPILPWIWAIARTVWHVIPIYLFGGVIWAGYELSSFNLLLSLTPEAHRPRFVAFYQTLTFLSGFAGPLLGGLLVEWMGFRPIFILSGAGRLLSTFLLIRFVRPPAREERRRPMLPAVGVPVRPPARPGPGPAPVGQSHPTPGPGPGRPAGPR